MTGLGVLGMCYVEDATYMLNGIGKAKLVGSDLLLVAWGLSLTSGVGLVLGLVGPCPWWGLFVLSLYLAVFRVRGAPPPLLMGAFFLLVSIHLALARLAFCLIKKEKRKKEKKKKKKKKNVRT